MMEPESSLNAKMFDDNFNNLNYENPHGINNDGYENIFSSQVDLEAYEYGSLLGMEEEPSHNYF